MVRAAQRRDDGETNLMSRCDRAYQFIKRQITANEMPAGSVISDQKIAEHLGISRTPIREAILLLEKEGFVEVVARRGIRVRPLFPEDIRELFDILTALETLAVALLCKRQLPLDALAPLTDAVRDMKAGLERGDFGAWIEADERFHRGLFELCGNWRLAQTGLKYRDQVQRAHAVALKLRPWPTKFVEGHAELVEIIRRGDGEAARRRHYDEWIRAGKELIDAVTRCGLKCL